MKKLYNGIMVIMEEYMIVIRDPKILFPNFDWPKYVDENLKHKIKLIEY